MPQYRLGEGPYGSAYAGSIDDLVGSGDLTPIEIGNRSFGLFLGHFHWVQTIKHVWEEPAKGIWAWLNGERLRREHVEDIAQVRDLRFTGDQHHLVVASSGAGKFRDVLSNMLLYDGSCETACLIIDPKGEIASTLGVMIDGPGAPEPRTVILDPWDLCGTGATDALTLLDGIHADNPHCVKDARVLADAIIVERGSEDGHWVVTAKNFLSAILLYICLDPIEKDERTLFRLRQIVTLPWNDLTSLLGYMSDSKMFEGMIARAAQAMLNRDEKERRAILSTLERDTAFVEDPGLWKAIKTSTFDMNKLVLSNKRLHVVVPFDYTEQMNSWLRLTIAAFYNACLRKQLPPTLPPYLRFRHIIIDEFAGLGRLDFIMKGIAEARGAGIKYHLIIQNFPQLHHLYKDGWENLLSNSLIHAFGVNDNFTAEYLSKMTGQSTVITESKSFSESTTSGTSSTSGSSASGSSSSSTRTESSTRGSSTTYSSIGRPLLTPDEIRRMSGYSQLLFVRGMPVLVSRRTPYFEIFKRFRPQHTLKDALASTRLIAGPRTFSSYGAEEIDTYSRLAEVNSTMRYSSFRVPLFIPYTLREALRQSPGFVFTALAASFLAVFIGYTLIADAVRQNAYEARLQEARNRKTALDLENARVDAIKNAKVSAEARIIDDRIRGPYTMLAEDVFASITRAGVCSSQGDIASDLSCSTQATYETGQLKPFSVSFNVQRKQFVTLRVTPHNEKRNDAFSGAEASLELKSVFERVDLNSSDDSRFHPSLRPVLSSMFRAFNIPRDILNACQGAPLGLTQTVNGTSVSCRFDARPQTMGGMAQFTLKLERPM